MTPPRRARWVGAVAVGLAVVVAGCASTAGPRVTPTSDGDGMVIEVVDMNPPQISDYKSKLTVYEGDDMVTSKIIEVNTPLSYKGYMFYQHSYDQEGERYTVLQVVKDPGVWLVMTGFALLALGVILKFYVHPFVRAPRKEEK